MSTYLTEPHRSPPGLYRTARLIRRLSTVVLVLLLIYVATAVYSAARLVESSSPSEGYSVEFAPNNTVEVLGSIAFSNPGIYPVQGIQVSLRVLNSTGEFLGESQDGPANLPAGGSMSFPIVVYVPVSASSPAGSLLVSDQPITVAAWGNATYAYLFPISIHFMKNETWGAPFADLRLSTGTISSSGGTIMVPVTVSFTNRAILSDDGTIAVTIESATGNACGGTVYSLAVSPGSSYSQTESVVLSTSCSLVGGSVDATYSTAGVTVVLPSEAIG